jgi:RNA polymerase sigma-70 factor (ECF subfamily)
MTTADFEGAVSQFKDRVHSYARHMLRDAEEAKDVAQECLVKLWQNRDRVDAGPACRSWLLRSAHNLCIDRMRRRSIRGEVSHGDDAFEPVDPAPGPERRASSSQAGRILEQALSGLSDRDRAIVLLREVEGLPYEEIATLLDLNMGTLKATLHRTRDKLRRELVRAEATP